MRYLMIHKIDESRPEASNPSPEFQAAMGAFMQECAESGVLLAAEGVTQSKDGAVLRKTEAGAVTVTDGPFTEAREVVGGFAVVKVESKEQALELAQRFMALFEEVSVEVRRIHEFEDLPPQS
jgi:hypothetical protein